MVRPLSEQLADLSTHARHAEESVASAAKEGKEKLDALLDQIRTDSKSRAENLKDDVSDDTVAVAAKWDEFRARVKAEIDGLKADVDEKKVEHDAKSAAKKADKAEKSAVYAIAFALDAIDNAELSVIDAIVARENADAY